MDITIYSDDINLLNYWEKNLEYQHKVEDDIRRLSSVSNQIILLNCCEANSISKSIIKELTKESNKVFILDRTPDINKAKEMLFLGVKAYGNALMKKHFLSYAIETIKDGMVWLHPELTSELIFQIEKKPTNKSDKFYELLSDREIDVAKLLKDGNTYKEIAEKLEITPRTVKAHAQNIYKKLQVKDRLALALLLK